MDELKCHYEEPVEEIGSVGRIRERYADAGWNDRCVVERPSAKRAEALDGGQPFCDLQQCDHLNQSRPVSRMQHSGSEVIESLSLHRIDIPQATILIGIESNGTELTQVFSGYSRLRDISLSPVAEKMSANKGGRSP
jgi:hypothetical protein